jgi:hypothetical protein
LSIGVVLNITFSFFVLIALVSTGKSQAETFLSSNLKFHTQELLVTSGGTARELYESLHVKEVEASLVAGLWFKNDEFLFCWVEPNGQYFCSIYLDFSGKGRLSSFHTDVDYGKGDPVDYVTSTEVKGEGKLYPMKWGMDLVVEGELAEFLRKKLYRAPYDKSRKVIRGEQIACSKNKCLVRVPFSKVDPDSGAVKLD